MGVRAVWIVYHSGFHPYDDGLHAAHPGLLPGYQCRAQNTITARDTKTGRAFQFQIGPVDSIHLKNGDAINADLPVGNVTSVKGVTRTDKAFEPDSLVPSCEIVSIQPNPAEPCCEIVSARNTAAGTTFQFEAEGVRLLKSLTVGQSVNVVGNWAAVQSSAIPGLENRGATFVSRSARFSEQIIESFPSRQGFQDGKMQ